MKCKLPVISDNGYDTHNAGGVSSYCGYDNISLSEGEARGFIFYEHKPGLARVLVRGLRAFGMCPVPTFVKKSENPNHLRH